MVSYFDIRAARTAMRVLQNKQLRNKKLNIHFSFPKVGNSKDGIIVFICALDLIILYMYSACLVYISYIDLYGSILTFCFLKNIFHGLQLPIPFLEQLQGNLRQRSHYTQPADVPNIASGMHTFISTPVKQTIFLYKNLKYIQKNHGLGPVLL